jgi:hypothetical protein
MAMVMQIEDKTEVERLLSLLSIGLCVAIEHGALSIATAEDHLYSPYTLEKLQELGVSPHLKRVVHLGAELEDVESLLPEKLDESLAEIKQAALEILRTLPANSPGSHWVQTMPATDRLKNATNGKPTPAQQSKAYAASST